MGKIIDDLPTRWGFKFNIIYIGIYNYILLIVLILQTVVYIMYVYEIPTYNLSLRITLIRYFYNNTCPFRQLSKKQQFA